VPAAILDREEYIEQSYFFRIFRERLADNVSAQDILERAPEELLSTTRLPMAIAFLGTELRHAGELTSGFARLSHYFTGFQAFVIQQSEEQNVKFSTQTALQVLEREAQYRSASPTPAGMFVYQFETICRNRIGYDAGLRAMAQDPLYDERWRTYVEQVRRQVGVVEFSELLYLRSEQYVLDQRKRDPAYVPSMLPLVGEKEGKIAKASMGRDPLFLFAALQRQLGYPEVPRFKTKDDLHARMEAVAVKFREMDARIKLLESEARGGIDLSQFMAKELPKDD